MASQMLLMRKPVQAQVISQDQSVELVHSLLLISFTTLCHLRRLVSTECLIDKEFNFGDESSEETGNLCHFKVLGPGKHPAADKVLLWLDGIRDALSKGVLETVQLSIILDKHISDEVIESYSFTFSYEGKGLPGPKRTPTGLTMTQADGASITVLPALPDQRYLTAHMFYTSDCPPGFQPQGFVRNESETMLVPDSRDWQIKHVDLGNMETGIHSVNFRASHLVASESRSMEAVQSRKIPAKISCIKVVERPRANMSRPRTKGQAHVGLLETPQPPTGLTQPALPTKYHSDIQMLYDMRTRFDGEALPPSQQSLITNAQDGRVLRQLNDMAGAGYRDSGPVQTQPTTSMGANLDDWKLTVSKAHDLAEKRDQIEAEMGKTRKKHVPEITCECGHGREEGKMIQCDCCDHWQHLHCYGLGLDSNIKLHACYQCLLADEVETLARIPALTRQRRALWGIQKHEGRPTNAEFAKLMSYEIVEFAKTVEQLKKLGVVKEPKRRNAPRLTIIENEVRKNIQGRGCLHPLHLIGHHYEHVATESEQHLVTQDALNVPGQDSPYGSVPLSEMTTQREHSDGETEELKSLAPFTPILPRVQTNISYQTPIKRKPSSNHLSKTGHGTKRFRSSQVQSPANVSCGVVSYDR